MTESCNLLEAMANHKETGSQDVCSLGQLQKIKEQIQFLHFTNFQKWGGGGEESLWFA